VSEAMRHQGLCALFAAGWLLLNFPLLTLWDRWHFGGRMWLRSSPGQGTCFGFELPWHNEEIEA
jgi:hypothetical protein